MVFLLQCASSIGKTVDVLSLKQTFTATRRSFHSSASHNLYFMGTFMMNTLLMLAIYNFTMLCKCRLSKQKSLIEARTQNFKFSK